ncbi:glyoxalase superfamily protein [Polycladidibacter stylochi]|uniref:glyoxalase superfamily protein n=1 Tax=Polycladidibacter stylochi TaxID=1807766 RepID=UPI00082CDA6D|nr:glyoxalase superfamily protein [Pseudovibrio stylochi]
MTNVSSQQPSASLTNLKRQAKNLKLALSEQGKPVSHSQALELVARQNGYKDWNSASALCEKQSGKLALQAGRQVQGEYMGQSFKGKLIAVKALGQDQFMQITVELDEAVDVVEFESFSNFRKRITCTLDRNGVSTSVHGNGLPHMRLLR